MAMESGKWFLTELIGKTVMVKTHWGLGTNDISLASGDYKGVLLGVDGNIIKLEYEIKKFVVGKNLVTKDIILINIAYIVTVNEYVNKEE